MEELPKWRNPRQFFNRPRHFVARQRPVRKRQRLARLLMQHATLPITQHVRFVLLLLVQNMKAAERLSYEFIRGVLNADFFTRTRYKT